MKFTCDTNVLVDVLRDPSAEDVQRFARANRVFTPSADAFSAAGKLLATLANREGWIADAHPSLVHDALLATSCRESGVTLITRAGNREA